MSIKIALAGNPNCGKTTLFNALTGSNQFVGNWPGVTVEKKEGKLKWDKEVTIMDLPGICDFKYRRWYQYREKPVSVNTDHGAWYSGCHGNQYDGSGSKERR